MSREFSKVNKRVWSSRKFRDLPDLYARHCYLYVLTCAHGNSAGCFDLPEGYATEDLKWSPDEYRKAFDSLCQAGLIEADRDEATVLITNWCELNEPTNARHAIGMFAQLDQASSRHLKTKRFHEIAAIATAKGYHSDPKAGDGVKAWLDKYPKPIEAETGTAPDSLSKAYPHRDRERDLDQESEQQQRAGARELPAADDPGRMVLEEIGVWDDPRYFGDGSRVSRWIEAGADLALDIRPTIRRLMEKRGGEPPKSLRYFEQAVMDAKATREKPVPAGRAGQAEAVGFENVNWDAVGARPAPTGEDDDLEIPKFLDRRLRETG